MKYILLILLFVSCSKEKACKGCTTTIRIYRNAVEQSRVTRPVDCDSEPKTDTRTWTDPNGVIVTQVQTTECK